MKRFSVICLQCGLSVNRLIDAETAQTEIHPVTYQKKCKIAPTATDFDCPELERAVEMSRRWDPIFQGGMSRPASREDVVVFPEASSDAEVKNKKLVAERADLRVEAADLSQPASSDDVVVFPEALSEVEVKNQKLVAEKAELSTEDLRASMGVTDIVNAATATPDNLKLDELRSALSKAL